MTDIDYTVLFDMGMAMLFGIFVGFVFACFLLRPIKPERDIDWEGGQF